MRIRLECVPFDELRKQVEQAAGQQGRYRDPVDQVRYLESYLRHEEAGASTIIVECPYVDRHWLEEYAGYYATVLHTPAPHTTRLHFYKSRMDTHELRELLQKAVAGDRDAVEQEFTDNYLGFAVIRPLPSAPLGRTILRFYKEEPRRCFAPAKMRNTIHLAGLTIHFAGLPFQQQDQGVGVCATTALWSALAKVMRTDGHRPPTPVAVTTAALHHLTAAGAIPRSAGLDLDQMAAVIRGYGYQAHVFRAVEQADNFILALKCYLRSGIPVVSRVGLPDGGYHAMTLAGFREFPELGGDEDIHICLNQARTLRSRGVMRWYVHDDRFGPYARLQYGNASDGDHVDHVLRLLPRGGFAELAEPMEFHHALVPLYPKLRLTAEELIEFAFDMLPRIALLAGDAAQRVYVEPCFYLGGEYLRRLHTMPLAPERIVSLCTSLFLSRYVGVLSWSLDDDWFCDIVYDTTDVRRDMRSLPPVLAVIPRNEELSVSIEMMRESSFGERAVVG